jgi:hypothetical protein
MKLPVDEATKRLRAHDHGVLSTINPERGIDSVPVVYGIDDDGYIGIPIDTVKPKTSTNLQREENLATDRRATLLVDLWDQNDWSRLWWVRVRLERMDDDEGRAARLADVLAAKYPQYSDKPFVRVMIFKPLVVTGWSAT